MQTVHSELLLPFATDANVTICLRNRVGEHVVEGTAIGWVWAPSPEDPRPAPEPFESIPRQPSLDRIRAAVRALRSKIDSQRSVRVMAFGGRS
jgi:hypothetical protein